MLALNKQNSDSNRDDIFNYRVRNRNESTNAYCWRCRNHYRFGNSKSKNIFWCLVLKQPVSDEGQCLAYDQGVPIDV